MSFVLAGAVAMAKLDEDVGVFGAEMGSGAFGKVG